MRFLERFSEIIYKAVAQKPLMRFSENAPEKVLQQSLKVLDSETIDEIKTFVVKHQAESGGFMDKAGKSDLYYSLFGCLVAEALQLSEIKPRLKQYLEDITNTTKPKGVHLHSAAILFSRLSDVESLPPEIIGGIRNKISLSDYTDIYSTFLNLLAFYYAKDYQGLFRVQQQLKKLQKAPDAPCTITAAILVLQHCFKKPVDETIAALNSFYLKNGSFVAVKNAPVGDLLSTAVALYALRVARADTRQIKPDCLAFVDSLYSKGGFCATALDPDPDIEYTFYGLLALGALAE